MQFFLWSASKSMLRLVENCQFLFIIATNRHPTNKWIHSKLLVFIGSTINTLLCSDLQSWHMCSRWILCMEALYIYHTIFPHLRHWIERNELTEHTKHLISQLHVRDIFFFKKEEIPRTLHRNDHATHRHTKPFHSADPVTLYLDCRA